RKALRRLSTRLSANHPQAVWKTLSPHGSRVDKNSPPILTRLWRKPPRGLSTRFSRSFPHAMWKTLQRVEHRSEARPAPGLHAAVAVRHDAMERARIGVEQQRQKVAVAIPQRQVHQPVHLYPFQRAFRIGLQRGAGPAVDHEHEAQPVLAVLAEARPADGAAQL